ncbi:MULTISPECIES: DUF6492 family protein [Cohnella]|uniref:DUF6492 family protein n=1 Tax=Cohnella TaxID=329857 RepID=UPI0009BAA85A|nr:MULTISPECIES: DUF6492 family protein [Cohnella]MBN2983648.1 hypothetical protein [Cohnella algarum]
MKLSTIDVIIPAIEKDLGTLPHVIDSVRRMVKHPIGKFMIIAPDTKRMRALCARKNCAFVHENAVLPIAKKDIRYRSARWERSGWLFQQLLKLGSDRLGASKYYLVIDADTVLIRPHAFRTPDGRTIFYYRNWSQPEYFRTYRKLMGGDPVSRKSFVTHYMLFDKEKVAHLKKTIEHRHKDRWYAAILKSMDLKRPFAFSEFETYGNFVASRYPGSFEFRKALNVSLHTGVSGLTESKRKRLASSYRSVSLHKRKSYSRLPK